MAVFVLEPEISVVGTDIVRSSKTRVFILWSLKEKNLLTTGPGVLKFHSNGSIYITF